MKVQGLLTVANIPVKRNTQIAVCIEKRLPITENHGFGNKFSVKPEEIRQLFSNLRGFRLRAQDVRKLPFLTGNSAFIDHAVVFALHFDVNVLVPVVQPVAA